jgi:prophage regulatory protein
MRGSQMSSISLVVSRLAGAAELQQMLGVSRKRAYELSRRGDFPVPLEELAMGPVWAVPEIEAWAERTHRTLHREPDASATAAR